MSGILGIQLFFLLNFIQLEGGTSSDCNLQDDQIFHPSSIGPEHLKTQAMTGAKKFFTFVFLFILVVFLYCELTTIVENMTFVAKDRFQIQRNFEKFSEQNQHVGRYTLEDTDQDQKMQGLIVDKKVEHKSEVDPKAQRSQRPKRLPMLKIFDFNHRKGIPHNYTFSDCLYNTCEFTDDPKEASLVMINGARLKMDPLPPRYKDQIWMMYTKEPPTFKRFDKLQRQDLKNQINWTRCIFKDSTFRGQYGAVKARPMPIKDYDVIYKQKRHQVAWFVSHCQTQSRREEYVARMSKIIDVHIFGPCGEMSCGKYGFEMGGQKDICMDMLTKDYKFYLSFENSMCHDYVTEKFYNMFEEVDIIPVVRSGFDYEEYVDPQAVVNTKDFLSPEELARHLLRLSADKDTYVSMLKKKNSYMRTDPTPYFPCVLCEAMHTKRYVPTVYEDIYSWMTDHCWEPNDL